jgi:hypothetical protein
MNLGGEAADQVVRYSIEGLDHGLRLSGTMAKNLAVFFAAMLKSNKKSYGKICMARMLKENRPLKFFTVPSSRIHEFAREGKKRGLPYVVIRDRKNPGQCELMVFADDAAKVNRVMDKMNLDFLKSENGIAVQEVSSNVPSLYPERNELKSGEKEPQAVSEKAGTSEMPGSGVQFELSDREEDFNIGDLIGDRENFTQAQGERNPSEPSSRSRDTSSAQGKGSEKPSVRKELEQIKKEKQKTGKKQNQRNRGKSGRKAKKKAKRKTKGR